MDLEGYARRKLSLGDNRLKVKRELVSLLKTYKNLEKKRLETIAEAVIEEVEKSSNAKGELIDFYKSNVTMGEMGVGSRGAGDFFVHRQIAKLVETKKKAYVSPLDQDDAGVIRYKGTNIVLAIDGTHSRLSDFPFLAGFHVARASARDVYVMGAHPKAFFADLHLADDGDISKLFDFMAGVGVVSSHLNAPVLSGSTLRVGGDMVIGERMVSGVGCIGIAGTVWARRFAQIGDVILMTRGAGGGTITTAAIYSGHYDVVHETINLDFAHAASALLNARVTIHSATDVTNGGLRGDCFEIAHSANVRINLFGDAIGRLVNPRVGAMLRELEIDHLGVSLDALLVICPPSSEKKIETVMKKKGIDIERIGHIEESKTPRVVLDGKEVTPRFRESAYTKIKKVYGETTPERYGEMKKEVALAQKKAFRKMNRVEGLLERRNRGRLHRDR